MKKNKNNMHTYSEAITVMAPSGVLSVSLPIYTSDNGILMDEKDCEGIIGININIFFGQKIGYLIYNEILSEFPFFMNSIDLFEDLGKINEN